MSNWVLLHDTVVRDIDIRRIEYRSSGTNIWFIITFLDGTTMKINVGEKGFNWCLKTMEAGKKNSAAAKKEFDGDAECDSDTSEFSE